MARSAKREKVTTMDTGCKPERREFLKALTLSTVALAVGGCGSQVSYNPATALTGGGGTPPPPPPPPVNHAPVWQTVPNITFTQGVASSVSIASYVSDPDRDALTITKNATALPTGVTYDQANRRFVYDGIGTLATTNGHILIANDGKP